VIGKVFPLTSASSRTPSWRWSAPAGGQGDDAQALVHRLVQEGGDYKRRFLRKMDFDQVPIKPQRVFKEINEFFDATPSSSRPSAFTNLVGPVSRNPEAVHLLLCGQAGPLGWEVPACLGIKLGKPNAQVVGVSGTTPSSSSSGPGHRVQNKVPM